MAKVKAIVVFIVVKCLMFNGICIKFYGFFKCFNIVHQNVHINSVDMCDVYVQDMLIGGIGTFHYHVIIIFL
jgi:hypothetical protein